MPALAADFSLACGPAGGMVRNPAICHDDDITMTATEPDLVPSLGPASVLLRWMLPQLAGLLLWPSQRAVAAEPVAVSSFEWSAPAGCPAAAAVRKSLAELIELDRARWDRFESIRGRVSRGSTGWQLELRFAARARTQTRRFEARDCADLGELAALTLALALDPDSQGWQSLERQGLADTGFEHSTDADAGDVGAAPLSTPTPSSDPLVSRNTAPEDEAPALGPAVNGAASRTHLEIGAGGVLDPTTLGAASFGASVWADASRGRWSAGAYGDWLPFGSVGVASRDVTFALAVAGLRACYASSPGLRWCPELEVGVLSASGSELEDGRSVRDLWLAPGGSAELTVPAAGALSLVARISLVAPLLRGRYLVNEDEPLHQPPALALRLTLGVSLPVL
jgi:hypothetical protein